MKGGQGPPLLLGSTLALYLGPLVWFLQGPGSQPRWGGGLGSGGSGRQGPSQDAVMLSARAPVFKEMWAWGGQTCGF